MANHTKVEVSDALLARLGLLGHDKAGADAGTADIERLQAAGAGAFLIGESLMREDDIEAKLRSLI